MVTLDYKEDEGPLKHESHILCALERRIAG